MKFQLFRLVLEKAEEPEIKLSASVGLSKNWQEFQKIIYFCFIDYANAFDYVDNHNGVITDLEPDILECEVKWALGSISTNIASGVDGIPFELFQS